MKRYLLAMLLCPSLVWATASYRVVHPDGSVEFTDRPVDNAEAIAISPLQTYQAGDAGGGRATTSRGQGGAQADPTRSGAAAYTRVAITAPAEEETLFFSVTGMMVRVTTQPTPAKGDQIAIYLDGREVARGPTTVFGLSNVYRGTHQIEAEIRDRSDQAVIRSAPVIFFMSQPRVRN